MQKTVVLGSGGHAKVVIEILREAGVYDPVACISPNEPPEGHVLGVPYVGGDDYLPQVYAQGIRNAFVALGDNLLRQALLQQVMEIGYHVATAVSGMASISPSAQLGRGLAVMPGAVIGPDTVIGDGCILNTNSAIDHDGSLGQGAHLGPGATLAGNVHVGDLAFVATGSIVIPEIVIGANTIVGAGSVVVRDLPADVVAYGVPAAVQRQIGGVQVDNSNHTPSVRLVS